MTKRVVIVGSGGQLGVELCREFEKRSWHVVRFDRQSLDMITTIRLPRLITSHHIATDARGNLYVASPSAHKVQKLVFKGLEAK